MNVLEAERPGAGSHKGCTKLAMKMLGIRLAIIFYVSVIGGEKPRS